MKAIFALVFLACVAAAFGGIVYSSPYAAYAAPYAAYAAPAVAYAPHAVVGGYSYTTVQSHPAVASYVHAPVAAYAAPAAAYILKK